MPIKSYSIWSNAELLLPLFTDKAEMSSVRSITWADGTTINSADIIYSMRVGLDGVQCWLDLNSIELAHEVWNLGDMTEKSGSVDVTSSLYNGPNIFVLRGDKGLGGFLERRIWITANLVIDYTGEDPDVKDEPIDWERVLLIATTIGISVVSAVIIVRSFGPRKILRAGIRAEQALERRLRERWG